MFSRDTKFSRDSKRDSKRDSQRDSKIARQKVAEAGESQSTALSHNGHRLPESKFSEGHFSEGKFLDSTFKAEPPSEGAGLPVSERSQSWQVAPNLFISFKYAWAGIAYAFNTQRNFRIHTGLGTIAMLLCWALHVETSDIAIICLTIGAVLVMEILNTALESLVDLTVGQTYHHLAKIAKDCAAGAVLMAAMVALIIAALIFVPPLWEYLHTATP
jgi:diacylglycerol kinase (ATP)